MTLKWLEGFDAGPAAGEYAAYSGSAVAGRTGSGNALRLTCNNELCVIRDGMGGAATIIVGFAFLRESVQGVHNVALYEGAGATKHIGVLFAGSGIIQVFRNTTLIAQSPAGSYVLGTWHHFEMKVTIHDTTGAVEIRIDGSAVLAAAGLDTRNGGALGVIDRVTFGANSGQPIRIDDAYVLDTAGPKNNDFLGDCVVETLTPTADGFYGDWTPLGGGASFVEVDETNQDADTTYISATAVAAKESFGLSDLATTVGSVFGVKTVVSARHDGPGGTFRPLLRLGGVDAFGTADAPGAGYTGHAEVFENDPAGGDWTIADVNAVEAGVEIVS